MDEDEITRRLLNITLEIISLLSGEDCAIVRKTSGDCVTPIIHLQESGGRSQSPIIEPPPHPPIHERKKKILELSNKMIELLTGEVPIRCQDVAVYLSLEEWEYLEGHKDRQKGIMNQELRPLISPDGSTRRNPPERCPRPLYPQDRPEEKHNVPESHQGEDPIDLQKENLHEAQEAITILADQQDGSMERNPPERCPRPLCPQDRPEEKHNVPESHQSEDMIDIKVEVIDEEEEMDDLWADQQDGSRRRNPPERCPRPLCPQDRPEMNNVLESHQDEDLSGIKVEVIDEEEEETMDLWADQQDELMERNPPERCPRPLYPQDRPEEKHNVPESHQNDDLTNIKMEMDTEEESMRGDPSYMSDVKDEIPVIVTQENHIKNPEGNVILMLNYKVEDENIKSHSSEENLITLNINSGFNSTDQTYKSPNHEAPSDESHIIATSTGQKNGQQFRHKFGKHFTKKSSLYTHRRTHTGEKLFSCSECRKTFTDKSTLVRHERSHTGERPFSCSLCGKCYINKSSLVRHEIVHTGEKPFSCLLCGKCFTGKSSLVRHERSHTGEKPYSCSECGKCFTQKSGQIIHQRIHTGEKPYSCSECGKCFTCKSDLVKHQRIHTGEKPHSCSECEKCFIRKADLVKHQRTHIGVKPYLCKECGKSFIYLSDFAKHQKIHTGEKPFSCSECGKCFITKAKLRDHHQIHTGEKPFSCSQCGKCFMDQSNFIAHKRSHKGEKPYSCSECEKCFTQKSNLVKHQRIHTGEKPYSSS